MYQASFFAPLPALPDWMKPKKEQVCAHMFALGLYVPPGQTVNVTCPYCGAKIPIHGSGATC